MTSVSSPLVNCMLLEVRSPPPEVALQGLQDAFNTAMDAERASGFASSHASEEGFTEAERIGKTQGQFVFATYQLNGLGQTSSSLPGSFPLHGAELS